MSRPCPFDLTLIGKIDNVVKHLLIKNQPKGRFTLEQIKALLKDEPNYPDCTDKELSYTLFDINDLRRRYHDGETWFYGAILKTPTATLEEELKVMKDTLSQMHLDLEEQERQIPPHIRQAIREMLADKVNNHGVTPAKLHSRVHITQRDLISFLLGIPVGDNTMSMLCQHAGVPVHTYKLDNTREAAKDLQQEINRLQNKINQARTRVVLPKDPLSDTANQKE